MPYKTKTDEVLTGGLNLLAPGKLTPDDQTMALQNWRADEHGALHSRGGSQRHITLDPQAYIHTMSHSGGGPSFYLGVGASLYRESASQEAGFSGQPLGIVGYKRFAWIMDALKQRKDDGSTLSVWLPDKPAGKPIAAPQSQQRKDIALFEPSEPWVTVGDNLAPVPFFDLTTQAQGSSSLRQINEAGGSMYATAAPLAANLGDWPDGSKQSDDDVFKLWVFATNTDDIENVHVLVDVNDGSFEVDYYKVTISGAALSLPSILWTEISILRQLPEGDVTGRLGFQRTGNTIGKDWRTAAKIRVQVDTAGAVQFHWDNFHVLGSVSGPLKGEYQWAVTFVNVEGHETNPSELSLPVAFDSQFAALTAIPVPAGGQGVVQRWLYRGGGSLGAFYRVGILNDAVTATFDDKMPDDEATALGIAMPLDNDPPPPAQGLAGPFFERLLAWNSAGAATPALRFRNRLWWSKTGQPWAWPGSVHPTDGNWVEVGEDGEDLFYVSLHKRVAWLYKSGSIWRLVGDPDDGEIEQTNANMGAVGPSAVANAGAVDYFVGADGVYSFNGDREQKISLAVDPIFRGQYVRLSNGSYVPPIRADSRRREIVAVYANGRLYVSYPAQGQPNNSETLVYDTISQRWFQHKLGSAFAATGFSAFTYSLSTQTLLGATIDGNVMALESRNVNTDDFGGTNREIPLVYQSGFRHQGAPDHEKLYEDVVIEHNTSFIPAGGPGALLTVKALFNQGATTVTLGQIRSSRPDKSIFQIAAGLGQRAYDIAIRIEGDNANSEVIVSAIYVHFKMEPRSALTYDSGILMPHEGQVTQVDRLEFEIEGTAPLDWKIYTDKPGKLLILRAAAQLSISGEHETLTVQLTTPVEGKRLRVILGGGWAFRLYSVRLRVLPIGEYIDGPAGEVWETPDLDFGG